MWISMRRALGFPFELLRGKPPARDGACPLFAAGASLRVSVLGALLSSATACGGGVRYESIQPLPVLDRGAPLNPESTDSVAVLIGAGDIADCEIPGAALTAAIIDSVLEATTAPAWVITLGDNAYPRGTERDFRECYHPTWGRFREITRPVSGNHEWKNNQLLGFIPLFGNADPYFAYFSSFPGQAGDPEAGWYRYRHGAWDVYAIDTRKTRYIERDGAVWKWLERELSRADRAECAVAYYHYPRFSSGKHGDDDRLRDSWELMARLGMDLFLAAHEHDYQSYHPQTADGEPDSTGVRGFVIGTGGGELRSERQETAGALRHWKADEYGVLKLVLYEDGYEWEYIVADGTVWDSGQSECQNRRNSVEG